MEEYVKKISKIEYNISHCKVSREAAPPVSKATWCLPPRNPCIQGSVRSLAKTASDESCSTPSSLDFL